MQDVLQNKTQVQTVNFRLYFKGIIRQNEIQYNLDIYNVERKRLTCVRKLGRSKQMFF